MKDILQNKIYINDIERVINNLNLVELNEKSILITGGLGLICSSVVDILTEYNRIYNANIHIYVADINIQKLTA